MKRLSLVAGAALLVLGSQAYAQSAPGSLDRALDGRSGPVLGTAASESAAQDRRDRGDRNDRRDDRGDRRGSERQMECRSRQGRRNVCSIDGRFSDVRVVSRTHGRSCRRDTDWGISSRGIWVSNGCGAVFSVRYNDGYNDRGYSDRGYDDRRYGDRRYDDRGRYGSNGYQLRCSSENFRRSLCRLPDNAYDVRISRRLSDARCRRGDDWGVSRRGVWVDNGCRASFSYTLRGRNDDRGRRRGY